MTTPQYIDRFWGDAAKNLAPTHVREGKIKGFFGAPKLNHGI